MDKTTCPLCQARDTAVLASIAVAVFSLALGAGALAFRLTTWPRWMVQDSIELRCQ